MNYMARSIKECGGTFKGSVGTLAKCAELLSIALFFAFGLYRFYSRVLRFARAQFRLRRNQTIYRR